MLVAAAIAVASLLWLGAILLLDPVRFVIHDPRAKTGFEMFLALGQLFGALVLALAPSEPAQTRMRWVAIGLLGLGAGTLWFAYLYPLVVSSPPLTVTMYGSWFVRTLSTAAIFMGLFPAEPPRLDRRREAGLILAGAVSILILTVIADQLPRQIIGTDLATIFADAGATFPGLTNWHWTLSLIPAFFGLGAVWGAVRHFSERSPGGWLLLAVVLLAAAQIHSIFWPSLYSSVLTTTSLFRLSMAIVVIIGGVFELRTVTDKLGMLLTTEQERVRQLEEIAMLKQDFTSMVAHELATPVAAIGMLAQMGNTDNLPAARQRDISNRIQKETGILQLLVQDIQSSMDVERRDFAVHPEPVSLRALVCDACDYASTLAGNHPITIGEVPDVAVMADADRVGQVLRNLLNNAVRHTPPGTPIAIRATPENDHIRIDISDSGPGIDPQDLPLIFEKFGRGRTWKNGRVSGHGLGLYLSQRILEAHGSKIGITSGDDGKGACFFFPLEIAK